MFWAFTEMQKKAKVSLWIIFAALCATAVTFFVIHRLRNPLTIMGAVTIKDADSRKELPIADVEITVANGAAEAPAKSDASGFFTLKLKKWIRRGRPITLKFRHPNYQPLDLPEFADSKLYIAQMVPIVKKPDNVASVAIGNVRVRYSIKAPRTMNVGSAVKAFEIKNVGNIPCNHQVPCSPDGKWKATLGAVTLDAGTGNEFINARVSCIAGPCPFTRIESGDISRPGQKLTAKARNWSDNATFLVEAEVIHVMQSAIDHQSYPVIFGSALNFTLPRNAEGVSFEADISGDTIIYPLGPSLLLSWANCNTRSNGDGTIYRCELKPGYRFQ
jgi:hypothetical protein